MSYKNTPVIFKVFVNTEGGIFKFPVTRYVTRSEAINNDVSYHAAIIASNGFYSASLKGEYVWYPPHKIDKIEWKDSDIKLK